MAGTDAKLQRLVVLLYVSGGLLLLDQTIDLLSTLASAPMAFSSAQWRFGAFGLLVTRASVLVVADAMVWAAAVFLEHRRLIRVLAVVHLLLAAGLAVGLGLFGLDALELRRQVQQGSGRRYDTAALRALAIGLLGTILLAWSGFAAWAATSTGGRRRSSAVLVEGAGRKKEAER